MRVLAVLLVPLVVGCGAHREDVQSNGARGELYLRHAEGASNLCGEPPEPAVCNCSERRIPMLLIGTHDLQVSRWLRVFSSNGLGDGNTVSEYPDIEGTSVTLEPPEAAALDLETCPDAVRLRLTVDRAPFTLRVQTEDHEDFWEIAPFEGCDCS